MTKVDIPSPTPRRVSPPGWLDRRLVLGVVLVLAAVLLGATVVSRARHTTGRLALTRDLAAGTTLQAEDLTTVQVQVPGAAATYLSDPAAAIGRTLAEPVHAGELLPAAALARAGARTTISVPFAAGTAPRLSRGQRLVMWLSTPQCASVLLLDGVPVDDVRTDAGSFGGGTGEQDVVISVAPDLADRVVAALAVPDATVRAGVLTGSAGAAASAPVPLPSLSGCTATGTAR